MPTQTEKAHAFQALHHRPEAFIIPNPWDAGSARMLEGLGFEALATTSSGLAFSLGRRDNEAGREAVLRHVAEVVAVTGVPVSGDLENGFGDAPETAAETIRMGAEAGLVGGSIEDSIDQPGEPRGVYELELAVERVRAAVEAARSLPFPFMLTARAENFVVGRPDLADTIRRLQAYQEAGADVLFAPGLTREDDIAEVLRSVDRPVNVLAGLGGMSLGRARLSELGVRRISIGGALTRAAYGAFLEAAREMLDRGTFDFAQDATSFAELTKLFEA
ncbi:MAG: isocitrate lyase/phosphoenolpyruvate mutase family protein [Acidobacteria bacterium]|nr:isocitrate lyase/phosphoenolpyruvate mutase family protein [Acidobacteriota bacterium]